MLNHRVKIVVPSTQNVNESIDNSKQVEMVATRLVALFGGATVRDREDENTPRTTVKNALGYWLSDTAGVVVEAVKEVESLTDSLTDEQIEEVIKIAIELRDTMGQESVLYEIDGIAYFTE